MRLICRLLLFFVVLPSGFIAAQDPAPTLSVKGDVQKPVQFTIEDLKTRFAGQVQKVSFTGRDKQQMTGTGLSVAGIVQAAGLKTDAQIRHHELKFFVIFEAKDSYQAFFALAELVPVHGGSPKAFLVWEVDGKPLDEKDAPLRLVLTSNGQAREIRAVTSITLVDGVELANQLKQKNR